MKRYYLVTAAICLAVLLVFSFVFDIWHESPAESVLRVGFLYENDESTPDTYNFYLAQNALEKEYGTQIQILSRSNVRPSEAAEPLRELAQKGCRIIFTNSHSSQVGQVAAEFPETEFCQVSHSALAGDTPDNCHSFNGKIYQGHYVNGIVAGCKLRELLDSGELQPEEAIVGFVAAYAAPEALSGSAAFLLGVRSVAPEAVLRVRCTGTWSSYIQEKAAATDLIREGCVILAQQTPTIGPAAACEEAAGSHPVYHVGYQHSAIDVAPLSSLVSTRINWTPYITGAVGAVMASRSIEGYVEGDVFSRRDMAAGFDRGWVEMLELNQNIAAPGTEERMNQAVEDLRKNRAAVFAGNYTGIDPDNPEDTVDLRQGYVENRGSSVPGFHYVLEDVMTLEP